MKKNWLISALLLLCCYPSFGQTQLIWTNFGQGQISTCRTDGTDFQELFAFAGASSSLTIDPDHELIYWVNGPKGLILRSDYHFQVIDTIVEGIDGLRQVALDPIQGTIYWSDTSQDHIRRAHTDGSGGEVIYEEIALNPIALFMDTSSQNLYFSRQSGLIGKIDLNTFSVTTITQASGIPTDLEIDFDQMKLYWSNQGAAESKIQRCNLDGSDPEDLVTGLGKTYGIALDKDEQKIYWTDWGGSFPKYIRRANLDGTDVEEVIELANTVPYALSLIDNLTVGVDSYFPSGESPFVLFPNPTSGRLTIQGGSSTVETMQILDGKGHRIREVRTNRTELDLSDLPAGLYILVIHTREGTVSKKILKL